MKNSILVTAYKLIRGMPALEKAPTALYALRINSTKLRPIIEAIETTRSQLCKQHTGKTVPDKEHPNFEEYRLAYVEVLDQDTDFKPHKFKFADLNLAVNSLPPIVLEELSWMMSDDDQPEGKTPPA